MSIDKEERKLVEKETKIFSKKDYEKMSRLSGNWEEGNSSASPAQRVKGAKLVKGDGPVTDSEIEKDIAWILEKMDKMKSYDNI